MKILLLSRYGSLGASSRIRMRQYIPRLEEQGIEITVAAMFTDDYLGYYYQTGRKSRGEIIRAYIRRGVQLAKSFTYDLLWIEKELFPFLPAWGENLLSLCGKPYVVDYDDAVFHNYDIHRKCAVRYLLGNKIDTVMRRAETVVTGNDYLAGRARRAGAKKVACIPSVIDLERYHGAAPTVAKPFTIGWIGSPPVAYYLNEVKPALTEICREGDTQVILIGAGRTDLPDVPVENRLWSPDREAEDIGSFDVGIMPLPDTPWEQGKCGFKLIQYMACGIPVIASPIGVNAAIVEHGVNGFLASTQNEWVRALRTLRDDPELRRKMGAAGRAKVEAKYCLQVTAPIMFTLLKETVRK